MKVETDHFEIATDAARRLISVTMRGFWDDGAMDRFQIALRKAMTALRGAGMLHILADGRDFPVQSQDNINRFGELLPDVTSYVRRVAVITPAALVRMQIARIDGIEARRTFADPDEALAWLFADDH